MTGDVSDTFAEVPGGRVFVRRWHAGDSGRPPIVLMHDSLGCVELWRDFPPALAQATCADVIAYDRLGFGKSTARGERPGIDFVEEEARTFFPAIREALALTRFSLFGHSVGGGMALAIAATQGSDCVSAIAESAQAFVEPRTLAGIRAAETQFADPVQVAKIARWHGNKARWVLDAWTQVWLSPEFSTWSLDAVLGRIRCPVLAIHGDLDEYGSEEFPRRIVVGVRGPAELAILKGCGHVPHRERRDEVLGLAAAFLTRTYEV